MFDSDEKYFFLCFVFQASYNHHRRFLNAGLHTHEYGFIRRPHFGKLACIFVPCLSVISPFKDE